MTLVAKVILKSVFADYAFNYQSGGSVLLSVFADNDFSRQSGWSVLN